MYTKPILILLGLTAAIALVCGLLFYEISQREFDIQKRVGRSIVVNGDTLVVMSHNGWTDNYMLSNGVAASEAIIDQNIIDD